jgi:RND family efflux transporter MFP subunit
MRELKWSGLILLAACVGCEPAVPEPPKAELSEVVVATPTPRDVTDYEEFTGHTDAIKSVLIKARVTGYLLKKDFEDGQDVKQGDVLYEIDDRIYKAALDSAEAMVAQGEAHRARLTRDYHRASNLFQRAAIGKQEFDLITSDLAEAEAQLGASKAQLETARLNMSFTRVQAPMSGQLSRTLVDPGNLVRQDNTILNDIVSTDQLYAYFDISVDAMERVSRVIGEGRVGTKDNKEVPVEVGTSVDADRFEDARSHLRDLQDEIGRLVGSVKVLKEPEKKQKAVADLEARRKRLAEEEKLLPQEFPYKGLVNFSENKLDAATGTLRVRGIIDNPAPASILAPGLFVRVRLPIGDPHPSLLIPEDSIGSDQGRRFVYVIDPRDEVEYRPIEVGERYEGDAGTKLRAIRTGLQAGERFIQDSDALRRVRPGARVKVLQPAVRLAAMAP